MRSDPHPANCLCPVRSKKALELLWRRIGPALTTFLVGCALPVGSPSEQGDKVVGGAFTEDFAAVGLLVLRNDSGQRFTCTATLIDEDTIISAAHCLSIQDGQRLVPVSFTVEVEGQKFESYIVSRRSDPRYSGTHPYDHDIGIAHVSWETPPPLQPIALWVDEPIVGVPVDVVGYGKNEPDEPGDGRKRVASLRVDSLDPNSWYSERTVLDSLDGVETPCRGDSGGPAIYDDGTTRFIMGVVSRGQCREYEIEPRSRFTRIDAHLDIVHSASAPTTSTPPEIDPNAGGPCGTGGTCLDFNVQTCDGTPVSGLCPGGSNVMCCL